MWVAHDSAQLSYRQQRFPDRQPSRSLRLRNWIMDVLVRRTWIIAVVQPLVWVTNCRIQRRGGVEVHGDQWGRRGRCRTADTWFLQGVVGWRASATRPPTIPSGFWWLLVVPKIVGFSRERTRSVRRTFVLFGPHSHQLPYFLVHTRITAEKVSGTGSTPSGSSGARSLLRLDSTASPPQSATTPPAQS
jgi:hypothetical protein